jgi:hypothetical protein
MSRTTLDPEWRELDFQTEVRPTQQKKVYAFSQEVTQIGDRNQANNERNLS